MSILETVTQNTKPAGQRIVISGVEKIGKTTFASQAPRTLLVPMEVGYGAIPVNHTKMITSMSEVWALLDEVKAQAQRGQFPFKSIAWDSATALERLIHDEVLQKDAKYSAKNPHALTMEAALGGYGKAYQYANELFDRWTRYCDELAIYGGINIIVTCHVFAARVLDPSSGEYDTWDLQLHSPKNQKTYGKREFITQWADLIGFLHEPMFVMKKEDGESIKRGFSNNQGRVLAVDRTPAYVAGNRYGMTGQIPIPQVNGWNALADAVWKSTQGRVDIWNRD